MDCKVKIKTNGGYGGVITPIGSIVRAKKENGNFRCEIVCYYKNIGQVVEWFYFPSSEVEVVDKNTDETKDLIVQRVLTKFKQRSEVGIRKYNTTLERNDLNTLEWLTHLQEELMDATLYIERLKQEYDNERKDTN